MKLKLKPKEMRVLLKIYEAGISLETLVIDDKHALAAVDDAMRELKERLGTTKYLTKKKAHILLERYYGKDDMSLPKEEFLRMVAERIEDDLPPGRPRTSTAQLMT